MKLIGQAQLGDLLDFTEGGGELRLGRVARTRLHCGEDCGAVVEAGADDERETEAREVGGVELLECGEFGVAQAIQAGAGLFAGGFGCEFVPLREAAGEIGVRADEGELPFARRGAHRGAERGVQVCGVAEGSPRPCFAGDPRRVLEEMAEGDGEGGAVE